MNADMDGPWPLPKITGHPPGMLQDDSADLSKWLAGKPDARRHAREAADAIGNHGPGRVELLVPEPEEAPDAEQPRLTVRVQSFPESNGKRNWTALLVRVDAWSGLVGNCGGITIGRGECWNRVAYEAERARLLIGERDTEPDILDYGDDIATPDEWAGEVRGGRRLKQPGRSADRVFTAPPARPVAPAGWMPIETAPKDGTAVLVMRDIWPGTDSGRAEGCNGRNTYVAAWWATEGSARNGRWVCYMDAVFDPTCPIVPTHWMPLPAAPGASPAAPAPVALSEEQIAKHWPTPKTPDYAVVFARAAIAEFCRINGITAPSAAEGGDNVGGNRLAPTQEQR